MPDVHVYLAVQRIAGNLSDANWTTVKQALAQKASHLSVQSGLEPKDYWHARTSLDGNILLADTVFNSDGIDESALVAVLATTFGIDPGDVGFTSQYQTVGSDGYNARYTTLSYPNGVTNRLRLGVFGFEAGGGWAQFANQPDAGKLKSGADALAYLLLNIADWQGTAPG